MPIYQIQGPDGSIYEIEGPAGASQRQLIAAARAYAMQQQREAFNRQLEEIRKSAILPEPPPEPTIGGQAKEFVRAIIPGAAQLLKTATTGAASVLPDEQERAVRSAVEGFVAPVIGGLAAEKGYEETVGRKLGEAVGSTLPFFAFAPYGRKGMAAGVATGVSAGAGEARERAEAKGVTGDERAMATALGIGPGLLDVVAPNLKIGKALITRAFVKGGVEGATEAAQQVAQNLIAQGVYDPSQEILVGSGEAGAYGAGAGALASMLVDLTIGRKAYKAARGEDKKPEKEPEKEPEKKAETALLGYDQKPFTPVSLPDGSVAATQEQYDRYMREQGERAEDRRLTQQLVQGKLSPEEYALARRGREAGLQETFGAAQPDLFGEILPTKEPAAGAVDAVELTRQRVELENDINQLNVSNLTAVSKIVDRLNEIPLSVGELVGIRNQLIRQGEKGSGSQVLLDTVNTKISEQFRQTPDKATPDMIEDLETRQIQELIDADLTPDQKKAQLDKLRFESALAETDAKTEVGREILSEQQRLALLLPVIEDITVKNIAAKFQAELRRAGITNLNLTPREEALIARAYDVRAAEPEVKEEAPVPTEPIAKAELGVMEAAIPERREGATPEQLGIPGIGKRIAPPAEEVVPAEPQFTTVLTPEMLDRTGLPKQSGFYRQLVNKDMANPQDAAIVSQVLQQVRANPNLSPATKQGVEVVAGQAFGALATQGEMFGPRGGVKEVPSGKPKRKVPTAVAEQPVVTGDRKGAEVAGRPVRAGAPARPAGSERPTVEATRPAAGAAPGRKAKPDVALKKELTADEMAAIEEEAAAELAGEAPARTTKGRAERAAPALAKEPAPAKPKAAPAKEAKAPGAPKAAKPVKEPESLADKGMVGYMMFANNNYETALRYLAGDLYYGSTKFDTASNTYKELGFGKENTNAKFTGGRYGKAFYESLSDADKKKVQEAAAEMYRWQQRDELNRVELELTGDALVFAAPHPEVRAALDAGDLVGALRILSDKTTGLLSQFSNSLAGVMGDTKVEIVEGLTNASGKPVPGLFDPKTNTIKLDKDSAGTPHALVHEAGHAALSHTLENKSHPVTKQLQQLFDDVKGWLDTAYGAQSLDEFASEAMSNNEFQQKLALINPKGSPITAWDRFKNIVGNMLRRLVGKPATPLTALDSATNLINLILSPAPNTRNAGELYSISPSAPNMLNDMFENVAKRAASLPYMNESKVNAFHEFFTGTTPGVVKAGVRMSLPLNALVDVAKKYLPSAPKLDKLINEKSAKESRRNESIDPIIREVETWAKTNPAKVDVLNEVALEASRVQVDPSKDRATYAKDKEKLDDYDRLKPMYTKLGTDGQAVYKQVRDVYDNLYQETRRVIDAQIDRAVEGNAERAKAKLDIRDLLVKRGGLDPYFPFTRSGDYWLSYDGKDMTGRPERYVEAFESNRAREQAIKDLVSEGVDPNSMQKFRQIEEFNYSNAPPTSFMNSLLKVLESNKVPKEAREQIIRLYVNTLPATSFAQSFQRRKNRLGYQKDVIGVLRNKTYNLSRQLSNIEYASEFGALRNQLVSEYRESKDQDTTKPYFDELSERIKFASSPSVPIWSKIATSIGFNMTLGFNISSALVNLTQVPLVVMPYLGGRYGYGATTKAIGNATRAYMNSGFGREVETAIPTIDGKRKVEVRAAPSLDNYNFDDPSLPAYVKRLKTLSEVAKSQGQLNRSQMYDILDVDDSSSILSKVNAASGFVFHHGERMNRQIAMIAAYTLELDKMKSSGRKIDKAAEVEAAEKAIYLTELTNGGTAAAAAPRIAQSGLGKVLFMFKRYGVSMYYMLYKTAKESLKDADPKVRIAAMKQIAGIYGSAAIFSGLQGVPLFGIFAMISNMFRDDDEDDFQTSVRKYVGELPYKGVVNAATGLEIATRVGLSDLIFRDQKGPEAQTVMLTLMETLGGPVYGVASRVERGLGLISEGYTMRGIEQMLPSAAGNVFKAFRYATEGANTLRGDPITGDLSAWNWAAQGFGFAPAEYVRQLEINANEKGIDRSTNEKRTNLLRKYYIAARVGDQAGVKEITEEMAKFNKRHPGAAITGKTILDSMKQHIKTSATMYHGITISKNMRAELMQSIAEYDDDLEEYDL